MSEHQVAQPSRDVAQPARRVRSSHIWIVTLLGLGCSNGGAAAVDAPSAQPMDASTDPCVDSCAAQGMACSLGRCTTPDCQTAESNSKSVAGCVFYTLQADNVSADEAAETAFLIANAGAQGANVQLEVATASGAAGNSWTSLGAVQLETGTAASLPITGQQVIASGLNHGGGLRIVSDEPITVAEVESDALVQPPTSSGGTALLPIQALGANYRVVTYPQAATPDVLDVVGSRGGAGRLMIVATQATDVVLTAASAITVDAGGAVPQALNAQDQLSFSMEDGDVIQIYSAGEGVDLSGTQIAASAPRSLAVFAGNISTTYGSAAAGINSADMAHEQMPPLASWSRTYVAPALTPEASLGCDSFFGPNGGSIWRVLAGADGTKVTLSGPGVVNTSPFPMMNAGDVQTLIATGSFTVSATSPILVTQGIDCEPSLSLAVGVDPGALPTNVLFAAPPSFDLQLVIVRPKGTMTPVKLDDAIVSDSAFTDAGAMFQVATVALAACMPASGTGPCLHQLVGSGGVGMTLRGMDVLSSFALTTPALATCAFADSCPD